MPISIEQLKKEGKPVAGRAFKKVDDDKLVNVLKDKAYTKAELAEMFDVKPGTIYAHLRKLIKAGKIKVAAVGRKVYYFAE